MDFRVAAYRRGRLFGLVVMILVIVSAVNAEKFAMLPPSSGASESTRNDVSPAVTNADDDFLYLPPMPACPVGFFGCNETLDCVEQRKNCDGTEDCEDGSDEWDCADVMDSSFWDHFFRKRPSAASDDLAMDECVWMDLNNTCGCRGDELHCQHRKLDRLPDDLPNDGISLLDLTGNFFPVLNRDFFNELPEVDIIVMKHCSIRELASNAFARFERIPVHTLYLDQNKVDRLPKYLFPAHNQLHVLVLAGNQINRIHDKAFVNLDHLIELDLRNNRIGTFNRAIFQPLKSLETLYLNGNAIRTMLSPLFPRMPSLLTLSLSDNQISRLYPVALILPRLEHLYLSGNRLQSIRNNTFVHLPKLLGLNLNDNRILEFGAGAFNGIDNLTSLLLEGNAFQKMDGMVLAHLTRLQYVYFSSFHLCKAAMHVRVCEPRGDGISSAEHLLDNPVLRTSVWIMALIGIVGNVLVLFGRVLGQSKRSNGGHQVEHSLYLRHLAASDLIMGVYLAVIAVVDIMYRGEYLQFEESWRHSALCSVCGFLSTLSCQSSTFLLTLITWDRLVSVTRPLQPRSANRTRAVLRLTLLWGASGVAAGSPLSSSRYFGEHFYGTNGVCLSLHIHDPYAQGWEYSASMFILVNSLSLVFIVVSYLKMLRAIRGSGEAMRSTLSGRENAVARRFAVIVTTDCLCWLPVISVKIAALAGARISPDLYAWLAVLVLPVNSALNPVLYTLTTASFKQQIAKVFETLPCLRLCEPRNRNHTGYESAAVSFSMATTNPGTPATPSSGKHAKLQRRVSVL